MRRYLGFGGLALLALVLLGAACSATHAFASPYQTGLYYPYLPWYWGGLYTHYGWNTTHYVEYHGGYTRGGTLAPGYSYDPTSNTVHAPSGQPVYADPHALNEIKPANGAPDPHTLSGGSPAYHAAAGGCSGQNSCTGGGNAISNKGSGGSSGPGSGSSSSGGSACSGQGGCTGGGGAVSNKSGGGAPVIGGSGAVNGSGGNGGSGSKPGSAGGSKPSKSSRPSKSGGSSHSHGGKH
ncbi:MAG TPA: hypothetical protein VKV26_12430 [Dehalococcoidia bacterium]|nr:hypothetical protein [Dehalococcoidia bacterium]